MKYETIVAWQCTLTIDEKGECEIVNTEKVKEIVSLRKRERNERSTTAIALMNSSKVSLRQT